MDYPPPQSPAANLNVFRPRRSDDWHEYREIIEQLYRNDQLKLRDVKRIMERDYQFYASEKQYKDRLAAWHVRKNIKAKQVHVMIRKQQKRAARGKQTAFRVNGQDVDPKRIARFVRRYGSSWDRQKDKEVEMQSPEPTTPSDMSCYTPEPEEAATPISPPEIQSPTRETSTYPLHYDPTHLESIPDLVIDDEQQQQQQQQQHYPLALHSNQPPPLPLPRAYHHPPEPFVHSLAQHVAHPQPHLRPQVQVPTHSAAAPTPTTTHPGRNLDTAQAQGEVVPLSDNWNRLDAFQNRLEGLQYTLDRTMSKWARDQDPNQENNHHEGLGM